ncbi:MAG: Phospholipase YtpA [Firmicutes bacterium ADurb.Bin419]|nr:MAG: Phospholipase YtpA [Firmicutes bacterium ADurb.Bin419]
MITNTFTFKSYDGEDIFVYKCSPEDLNSKGVVQIIHGLSEHAGRYLEFAKALTSAGYIVYAHDQRGHGRTSKDQDRLVHIDDGGWKLMMNDCNLLTETIKRDHPYIPVFIFGHSMGSFILRNILQDTAPKVDGVILSGTGLYEKILVNAGILIAKTLVKRKGGKKRSYYINRVTFLAFNSYVPEPKTFFDWLSRDEKVIESVLNDPLYRIHCSNNLFLEMFNGLRAIQNQKCISKIPKDLPILLISGDKDPVGHWGRDIPELSKQYKSFGIKKVQHKLYPGARHELINETNKDEVIHDIINWLDISCTY